MSEDRKNYVSVRLIIIQNYSLAFLISPMTARKKLGRPKKYATEAERKAAKKQQTKDSQKRQGSTRQKQHNKRTNWRDQRDYQRRTGYEAQKRYRERRKERERLENLARTHPTPPLPQPQPAPNH